MSTNSFQDIEKLEADLWAAADNLRANSKLTSSDYFLTLGVSPDNYGHHLAGASNPWR